MTERPDERTRRLSTALRANLRKRKAQARRRNDPPAEPPQDEAEQDADERPPKQGEK